MGLTRAGGESSGRCRPAVHGVDRWHGGSGLVGCESGGRPVAACCCASWERVEQQQQTVCCRPDSAGERRLPPKTDLHLLPVRPLHLKTFRSRRRIFIRVVASGMRFRPRSIPTKRRSAVLSSNASSQAASARLNRCWTKYIRSMPSKPTVGRPLPDLGSCGSITLQSSACPRSIALRRAASCARGPIRLAASSPDRLISPRAYGARGRPSDPGRRRSWRMTASREPVRKPARDCRHQAIGIPCPVGPPSRSAATWDRWRQSPGKSRRWRWSG